MSVAKVTITLDDDVAGWARAWAADHETSVSRMVSELLRQRMLDEHTYETAMQAYKQRGASLLKTERDRYWSREQIHER